MLVERSQGKEVRKGKVVSLLLGGIAVQTSFIELCDGVPARGGHKLSIVPILRQNRTICPHLGNGDSCRRKFKERIDKQQCLSGSISC